MDDLILRRQAIYALSTITMYKGSIPYNTAVMRIKQLPSVQPEIIRCCECKYLQCNMRPDGYLPKGVDEFECRHWCGSCDPMDFCSQAERRTE